MTNLNRKIAILLVAMITCTVAYPTTLLLSETYMPLLSVTAKDIYLTAGEENQIEIKLSNNGDYSVFEVEALLSVPSSSQGISIIGDAHRVFTEIRGGKDKTYHPIIYVNRDTPLGSYSLTYTLSYIKRYKQGTFQPTMTTVQLGVVVNSTSKPLLRLDFKVENPALKAGIEEGVDVTVENIGGEPVFEVDASITSTSAYIAVVESGRLTLPTLETNTSVKYTPILAISRSTPLGVYALTASVSYKDSEGQSYAETFPLGVHVDSVLVERQTTVVLSSFETSPQTIRPGDAFNLDLELMCTGAEAFDVKTSASFEPGSGISPISPTLVAVGDLYPNSSGKGVRYSLLADGETASGQYPVTITIAYLDSKGLQRSLIETVTVSISGIVNFRLLNDVEIVVDRGGKGNIEADLLLIGTESVSFVQIDIVEGSRFKGIMGSQEYIGPIDPDSPVPFDIQFSTAEGVESGANPLLLNITYVDHLNKMSWHTIEISVTVMEAETEVDALRPVNGFWLWLRRLFGVMP